MAKMIEIGPTSDDATNGATPLRPNQPQSPPSVAQVPPMPPAQGKEPAEPPTRVNLNGKSIAVLHGHESGFRDAVRGGAYDYLMHGHTHERRDERINGMRIVNPGALHRARIKTVATLDTETDTLTFHKVDA